MKFKVTVLYRVVNVISTNPDWSRVIYEGLGAGQVAINSVGLATKVEIFNENGTLIGLYCGPDVQVTMAAVTQK